MTVPFCVSRKQTPLLIRLAEPHQWDEPWQPVPGRVCRDDDKFSKYFYLKIFKIMHVDRGLLLVPPPPTPERLQ